MRRILVLLATFSLVVISVSTIIGIEEIKPITRELQINNRAVHTAIRINNDPAFSTLATSEGWAGSGTSTNPYIIRDYEINGSGRGNCIYIGNTTKYFIIENCTLYEASGNYNKPYSLKAGITLFNVKNGRVVNCNFSSNEYYSFCTYQSQNIQLENSTIDNDKKRMWLFQSQDISVINNSINNSIFGVEIGYSGSIECHNNTVTNSTASLFTVLFSDYVNISRNVISDGYQGLHITASDHINTSDNFISDNIETAIYIHNSLNQIIKNNSMWNGSIYLTGKNINEWNSHFIDTNNSVNNKPLYYLKDSSNACIPSNAGEVILANCSNISANGQNHNNTSVSINIGFSDNISISNSTFNMEDYMDIQIKKDGETFFNITILRIATLDFICLKDFYVTLPKTIFLVIRT